MHIFDGRDSNEIRGREMDVFFIIVYIQHTILCSGLFEGRLLCLIVTMIVGLIT